MFRFIETKIWDCSQYNFIQEISTLNDSFFSFYVGTYFFDLGLHAWVTDFWLFSFESYLLLFDIIITNLLNMLLVFIPFLLAVAFLVLSERKVLAALQKRQGPNDVGPFGILQSVADGVKLILKLIIIPTRSNRILFLFFPLLSFVLAFSSWGLIPFSPLHIICNVPNQLLIILVFSSMNVYSIIFSGWSSNSKYAVLGSMRAAAQFISYEIALLLSLLPVVCVTGSLNFVDIVHAQASFGYFFWTLAPSAVIFYISCFAETNRPPFDMPEAESELVAGYNVEYSSIVFAFFFLAEYSNILLMSAVFTLIFLGGWLPFFSSSNNFIFFFPPYFYFFFKLIIVSCSFIYVRGFFPRYRYDQLMFFCWRVLLPFTFSWLFFFSGILLVSDNFYQNSGRFGDHSYLAGSTMDYSYCLKAPVSRGLFYSGIELNINRLESDLIKNF